MVKVLLVIAPANFRDEEYFEPKKILEKAGIEVVTASLKTGEIRGAGGQVAQAKILVSQVDPSIFEAVVFIGGPGMVEMVENQELLDLAKKFFQTGKIVAAICVAPEILANADCLKNISTTCWQGSRQKLLAKKINVVAKPVVWSGKVITADGPNSAKLFGQTIVKALIQ